MDKLSLLIEVWEIYWGAWLEKILSNGKLWLHKNSGNQTTGKSPFEVVYERQPMHLYDLDPLQEMGRNSLKGENMVNLRKKLHEEIKVWEICK